MPDPGACTGSEEVRGARLEVLDAAAPVEGHDIADVDDGRRTGQRLVEPRTAHQVHARRAGEHHGIVPGVGEGGHDEAPDQAGATGYCNPHVLAPSSGPARAPKSRRAPRAVLP